LHIGGSMRWIIGIVVLVVVAILGYQYFGGARDVDVVQEVEQGAEQAAEAVGETAEEAAEATEQAASEAAQDVEEAAEGVTEEVEGTADEATQATQDTAEQAAEATEETAEQAAEATQEAADQAAETAEQATEATEQAASDAAGAVESATEEATEEVTAATESATEQAGEAAGAVQESLTEAQVAALTVGDVNVGEQVSDVVANLETSLEGVTDAASAEAALPTLTEINTQLEDLSGTVGQLPEDARKILADFLDDPVTQLKTTAESVMNQEGVGDVLRPALEPIMATLDSWAQQPA
ncbi:MAG: hypothetical protein R3190_16230, partial [Thermoanaerobaculia bacterium]|nr:hypothetical protein [Thermoanaerobaculia bacterium]